MKHDRQQLGQIWLLQVHYKQHVGFFGNHDTHLTQLSGTYGTQTIDGP